MDWQDMTVLALVAAAAGALALGWWRSRGKCAGGLACRCGSPSAGPKNTLIITSQKGMPPQVTERPPVR